jgi:hypothetical protein
LPELAGAAGRQRQAAKAKGLIGYSGMFCYAGNMAAFQGDLAQAEQALMEAIRIGRESGNPGILSFALGVLSHYVALPRGDIAAARTYAEESTHFAREIGMSWADRQATR